MLIIAKTYHMGRENILESILYIFAHTKNRLIFDIRNKTKEYFIAMSTCKI